MKLQSIKWLVFGVSIWALQACSVSVDGEKLKDLSPQLNLFDFFNGKVKAWGIVQNRSGNVVQRFKVDISGTVTNDTLTLDEQFVYGLGSGVMQRQWVISQQADGQYVGRADDILGQALGTAYGNGFNFAYSMDLPVDDTNYKVNFDDWFWAFDDTTLMNRSYITKFGIVVAEVTIFMQKVDKV